MKVESGEMSIEKFKGGWKRENGKMKRGLTQNKSVWKSHMEACYSISQLKSSLRAGLEGRYLPGQIILPLEDIGY